MSKNGVGYRFLLSVLLVFLSTLSFAQTFVVQPAKVEDPEGDFVTRLLLPRDNAFRIDWTQFDGSALNLNSANAKLIIGRNPNTYDFVTQNVSGLRAEFVPDNIGLSPGRYYARVTNSSATTSSEIQDDFENDPTILFSNEIQLIVEANEAPSIIAPRGTIEDPAPTFQWSAVSGVPSYWLIVSSTPFDIVEDENGEISIEGATIVWQYITNTTTAVYGDINAQSPFEDIAPPLNSGQEYSYTVLNVYEENNPTFTSAVFGGIVPFVYNDPNAIPATTLISPPNNETYFAEEIITFEWEEVSSANNYTVNLFQVIRQQGIDVTIPIWISTTTNTIIEYPALENLKNGRYEWNVIANNSTGGGSTSSSRYFSYEIETGEFGARIRSSVDDSELLGAELNVKAISGGVTPVIPFFVQSETHYDSLVAGTYEFTVSKDGYESATTEQTIRDDATTVFTMQMTPLPSSIEGIVVDENNEFIQDAQVILEKVSGDTEELANTDGSGNFSFSLNEGTYEITVSKTGFISAESQTITVGINEQAVIDDEFILTNDEATISGYVYNDQGEPIQRAGVSITDGVNTYEDNTNGEGLYQFIVSSGSWTLSAEKIGFVKPSDQTVSLSTGDLIQNQNFTLTGNANQITGFVRERTTNEDGSSGTSIFADVEVKAIPSVGEVISTRSGQNGQYTLSLRSGSYTIEAVEDNYTSSESRELVIGIAVGETISGMDFELIPNPSSISGTVTLPNGNGVADATVSIQNGGTTTTSGGGYYELSVPEGTHRISVTKSGLVSPDAKSVSVSVGQELSGVDFQMTPNAGSVSGKITSGGESLSNTQLLAVNNSNGTRSELTNNLDGTYTFNLSSGDWYIKAEKAGFISDSTDVLSVGPGQQLINQNLSLVENLTTVRGTITDGENALRNATILVTKPNNSNFEQSTITQINGTYAFSLPAGEVYQLRASKNGYRSTSIATNELVAGNEVVQDFELAANPSSVAGIISTDNDQVVSNAVIIASNAAGTPIDSVNSGTNGSYLLGLEPGTYTIKARKAGYTTNSTNTTLNIGETLNGINLRIDENFALISGVITDTDDNALEQVFINLTKSNGRGASTVTDQEGNFNISGLTSGSFTLELSKTGYISTREVLEISDGDFVNYPKVLVPKNGSITGLITDENALTLSDATVIATNTEGVSYTAVSSTNGTYTITGVEPSNYSVNASKTGYTSDAATSLEVSIDDLNVTGIDVVNLIPNNGVITGTITNQFTGDPILNVEVSAIGNRGSGLALTSSDGTFEISNLIPAEYLVISQKEGFKSDTVSISIDPASPTASTNRTLLQNNGTINGQVLDENGGTLPFRVSVLASSESQSLTTQTDAEGLFSFEGIETGVIYTLITDIYREGYENTDADLNVPLGADEVQLEDPLSVVVRQGKISGNVGISGASVKLLRAGSEEIIELATSNSAGNYTFDFLESGNYQVSVNRSGYEFTPAISNSIQLSSTEEFTQNFNAVANIGTITVVVSNVGNPQSNVNVTIISADTSVVRSKKTSPLGRAIFTDIKASTEYTIRASFAGYSTNPEAREVMLSSGDSTSTSFELIANSSSISGTVKQVSESDTTTLRNADIALVSKVTGQKKETSSNSSGSYEFANLSVGDYLVIATGSGFTPDTVEVSVSAGSSQAVDDLVLNKASVNANGFVLFKDSGVQNVKVEAISTNTTRTLTNTSGRYTFGSLPVKTGATDTTVYQIKITSGLFTKSYLLSFTTDDIGTVNRLPNTFLPSGQINLTVTDGVNPLQGATLEFGLSGGESRRIVTGSSGAFQSEESLRKATYVVSVSKEGLLAPQNTIRIQLPTDTTIVSEEIVIPYRQLSVNKILADEPTKVTVVNASGYDNSSATGILYYKKASQNQFRAVAMTTSGDSLSAEIPATNSTELVTFYTSVDDSIANNVFVSRERSVKPLASGILTNIRVTPTINNQTLRVGEIYELQLFVRDGVNKSLEDDFTGDSPSGQVSWTNLSDTTGVSLTNQAGTSIQLQAIKAGTYSVRVAANLAGSIVTTTLNFTVRDIPLDRISVSSPGKQLDNSTSHIFSYAAFDTSGNAVLLGSSLAWEISPPSFGNIDQRGVFTPSGENLLGLFNITVTDTLSKLSGNTDGIELVARIQPDEEYLFNNGDGLILDLPTGSVDIPSFIALTETQPAPSKKFVFAQGTDQSYTVGDRIYILSLSGSELKSTARLTLPEDTTFFRLDTGVREVGKFNFTTLQWELFETTTTKSINAQVVGTIATDELGQFAVLSQNQPLGIRDAAVLPSPFSPDIAPVKIGYWLDTAFPPARVSINIYNMRGELVKTILDDALQQAGRYGSRSSSLEISWDGRTDDGRMARNGRYIIQIRAKDQLGEKVKLLQVILIK